MSVDLNANFINKKSLMSICVIFKFTGLRWLSSVSSAYTASAYSSAAQKPQPYPLILVDAGWLAHIFALEKST